MLGRKLRRKLGRKLRDLSIVINCLCGDSERAPALLSGALEAVELSPLLRSASLCWVFSAKAANTGGDLLDQLARRQENYGDVLASSGYRGFPHGALLKSELVREVAWSVSPPEATNHLPIRLFLPREPDARFSTLPDAPSLPSFEGILSDGNDTIVRFVSGDGGADLPGVILDPSSIPSRRPRSVSGKRRLLRSLIPRSLPDCETAVILIELMYEQDIAVLRGLIELTEDVDVAVVPLLPALKGGTTSDSATPVSHRRRSPSDERAFLAAAEIRGASKSFLDENYAEHVVPTSNAASPLPIRRELAVPMTGRAILEESGMHAVFEEGRLTSVTADDATMLGGGRATSWLTVNGTKTELEMADAISFQNDVSRGLRSSFVTREGEAPAAGVLIDAVVIDGHPILFLEIYLSIGGLSKKDFIDEVVPLRVPLGRDPSRVSCRYPDGEVVDVDIAAAGRSVSVFGSQFEMPTGSHSVSIAYLHPSSRYIGEALVEPRIGDGRDGGWFGIGPLMRGAPGDAVDGFRQRFVVSIAAGGTPVPERPWPSELGVPGIWSAERNREVKG